MSGVRTLRDARRLLHGLEHIGAPVPTRQDFTRAVALRAGLVAWEESGPGKTSTLAAHASAAVGQRGDRTNADRPGGALSSETISEEA